MLRVHQCPDCVLRFALPTELADHVRREHPDCRWEYPDPACHPVGAGAEQAG